MNLQELYEDVLKFFDVVSLALLKQPQKQPLLIANKLTKFFLRFQKRWKFSEFRGKKIKREQCSKVFLYQYPTIYTSTMWLVPCLKHSVFWTKYY